MCDNNSECVLQSFIIVDDQKISDGFGMSPNGTISPDSEKDVNREKDFDFGSIIPSNVVDEESRDRRKSSEKSRSTSTGSFGDIEFVEMEEAQEEGNTLQDVRESGDGSSESHEGMTSSNRDSIKKKEGDETDPRKAMMTDLNESVTNEEEITSDNDRVEKVHSKSNDTENRSIKMEEIDNLDVNEEVTKDSMDFRVNVIERSASWDTWKTNESVEKENTEIKSDYRLVEKTDDNSNDNETEALTNRINNSEENKELTENKDESDFRVNVIERNESKDTWVTNQYVEIDDKEIKSENGRLEKTGSKLNDTENGSIKMEEIENLDVNEEDTKDSIDFRVNVIERNESNDTWRINEFIEKEDLELSNNSVSEKTDENSNDTQYESLTKKIDNNKENEELKENQDETDFRVNVIERNESNDTWRTNEFIENVDNEIKIEECLLEKTDIESDQIVYESEAKVEIINSSIEKKEEDLKDPEDNKVFIKDINKEQIDNLSLKEDKMELENDSKICKHTSQDTTNKLESDNHIESPRIDTEEDKSTRVSPDIIPKSAEQTDPSKATDLSEKLSIILPPESDESTIKAAANAVIPIISISNYSPKDFKSFSAIIGMLYNCTEFRDHLINYHHSDQIANIDFDVRQDITVNDAMFVNDICKLFVLMVQKNGIEINHLVRKIQKEFHDRRNRFDLYKGFNFLLEKINSATKSKVTEINTFEENCDISFFNYKCENRGFVHDLFYGQISIKTFCDNCKTVHHEQYEPINSLLLDLSMIQKNNGSITLEECLQRFLSERQISSNDKVTCCSNLIIKETREITHSPEYLFICLNRESANGKVDERFVETDNGIIVPVRDQTVLYQLCSVIDCSHYNILKCFSNYWWNIDNSGLRRILEFEIVSNDSCGFLFKKQ